MATTWIHYGCSPKWRKEEIHSQVNTCAKCKAEFVQGEDTVACKLFGAPAVKHVACPKQLAAGTAGKVPRAVPVQATITPLSGDGSAFVSATNEVFVRKGPLIDLGSDAESAFTVPASVFAESAAVDDDCSASSGGTEFPTPEPGKPRYSRVAGRPKGQAKKAKLEK